MVGVGSLPHRGASHLSQDLRGAQKHLQASASSRAQLTGGKDLEEDSGGRTAKGKTSEVAFSTLLRLNLTLYLSRARCGHGMMGGLGPLSEKNQLLGAMLRGKPGEDAALAARREPPCAVLGFKEAKHSASLLRYK